MVLKTKPTTIDEFREFVSQPENSGRLFELISGEIVEVPPGRTSDSGIGHLIAFEARLFCRDTDKPYEIRAKRQIYLQAKILYWELYPLSQTIDVYAPGQPPRTYGIDDTLDSGDVLPGFTLPVKKLFDAP